MLRAKKTKTYLHPTVLISYESWQIKRARLRLPQEIKGAVAVGRDGWWYMRAHWAHEASTVIFQYNLLGARMQSCHRPPAHRHPFQHGQTRASLAYFPAVRSMVSFSRSGSVDEDSVGNFFQSALLWFGVVVTSTSMETFSCGTETIVD
jgi:hypothetical protein